MVPPPRTSGIDSDRRQSEIVRSLGTSSAREARLRAQIMWTETERVFQTMKRQSLAAEHVAAILRRLREEPLWDSPTRTDVLADFRDIVAATRT